MQPVEPGPRREPGPGEAFARALLEDYADVLLVLGDDGKIRYATPSAVVIFGRPVIGRSLPDLAGDDSHGEVAAAVERMLGSQATPGRRDLGTWLFPGRDGQGVHVEVSCSDLRGSSDVRGLALTLRDVTRQHTAQAELWRLAFHDPLTGLPNRALFMDRAGHAAALARGAGTTAAVMYADLDGFKAVNDTLGHSAGDELLSAAAGRLTAAVRESDTVARLGGDEFAVLLESLPEPAAAGAFACRVVAAFTESFSIMSAEVSVGISVGVAVSTSGSGETVHQLLDRADRALYAAKRAGKGTWRVDDGAMAAPVPGAVADLAFPGRVTAGPMPATPGGTRLGVSRGESRRPPHIARLAGGPVPPAGGSPRISCIHVRSGSPPRRGVQSGPAVGLDGQGLYSARCGLLPRGSAAGARRRHNDRRRVRYLRHARTQPYRVGETEDQGSD